MLFSPELCFPKCCCVFQNVVVFFHVVVVVFPKMLLFSPNYCCFPNCCCVFQNVAVFKMLLCFVKCCCVSTLRASVLWPGQTPLHNRVSDSMCAADGNM